MNCQKMDYIKEVETVLSNSNEVLGFRVRRRVLYGIVQEVADKWYICRSLVEGRWDGPHETRSEARRRLIQQKEMELNNE